ncbi:uncharacterized protein LY89DRAFT_782750 [Mollisia scopiformis]|uniref:Uncharacterized protein n=1 Tax=Mollisia scopiformis TaxID=149040 RepID=A0A194X8K6_MOLSC|nr:uncharacterized protein LY89DRAFT_782750 [Mollisia scopiformis]KUJ16501.1 hypothetical protein LY89DRAFT_782750 [Mollisia scopiformis]
MDISNDQTGNKGSDQGYEFYLYPRQASGNSRFVLGPASEQVFERELMENNTLSEIAFPVVEIGMTTHDMGLQDPQWPQEQNWQVAMRRLGFPMSNLGLETDNMVPDAGESLETLLDYHQLDPSGEWRLATPQDFPASNTALGIRQEQPQILSAGFRADPWPKALEDYLMASRKNGCTYPEISAKMLQEFGVERSANVLQKKHRMIRERDAEENGIMQFLKGATPSLLRCLQDEMNKLDPKVMNEELRQEVWEELQRKLPKLVHTLALQTRIGN